MKLKQYHRVSGNSLKIINPLARWSKSKYLFFSIFFISPRTIMYIVHNTYLIRELQLTITKIEANSSVIIFVLIL